MKEKEIKLLDDLYKKLLNDKRAPGSGRWMYIDKLDETNWEKFIERHKVFSNYDEFQKLLIGLANKELISIEYDEKKESSKNIEFHNLNLKPKGIGNCEKRKSDQILQYIYEFTVEGGCKKIKLINSDIRNEHWNKIPEKINVKPQYYPVFSELMIDLDKDILIRADHEGIQRNYPTEFRNVQLTETGKSFAKKLISEEDKFYHIIINNKVKKLNLNQYVLIENYLRPLTFGQSMIIDGITINPYKLKMQIFKSKKELDENAVFDDCDNVTNQFELKLPKAKAIQNNPHFNYDYAIITALYQDEMKPVEDYLEYEGTVVDDQKKLIRYGTLKSDTTIKVVYASLLNVGMVDAAIVATDIIKQFQPKFLIMPGVCGGRDDKVELGDIIVAKNVFTFQKGKENDDIFEDEWEGVDLNGKAIQQIQAKEEQLKENLNPNCKIHYAPVACSTAVVNKKGRLKKIAENKDRKTIALEMEGYGIARACDIANNGNTKCLIIKSVMDLTEGKDDKFKEKAAKNSADFVMKLIEMNVLELD